MNEVKPNNVVIGFHLFVGGNDVVEEGILGEFGRYIILHSFQWVRRRGTDER